MLTILYKEFRQHGLIAAGVIGVCLFLQIAYVAGAQFFSEYNYTFTADDGIFFLGTALWTTLIYGGVAAALVYSSEHAEKTFGFLRRLPISPLTIALGKTAWVLGSTALVFVITILLAAAWLAGLAGVALWDLSHAQDYWLIVGIGIIEVLVWGLFWTTRFRKQYHALLATIASPVITLLLFAYIFFRFFPEETGATFEAYLTPFRLTVCTIVAFFAVWGMLRWFRFDVTHHRIAWIFQKVVLIRYPNVVQPPFLALIHQHVRHASVLYPFGIFCFVVWSLGCIISCFVYLPTLLYQVSDFVVGCFYVGIWVCIGGMFFFWGTIFGHDQKDDSYRVLQRMGIPEGNIWWSRILLPMLLYFPVLTCTAAFVLVSAWKSGSAYFPSMCRRLHVLSFPTGWGEEALKVLKALLRKLKPFLIQARRPAVSRTERSRKAHLALWMFPKNIPKSSA